MIILYLKDLFVVAKKGQKEAKEDKGEKTMVESAPASAGSPGAGDIS